MPRRNPVAPPTRHACPHQVTEGSRTGERYPPVRERYPELVAELVRLLRDAGEPELAVEVRDVPYHGACDCGDDFCRSIRTAGRPGRGPYGEGHRCVPLRPDQGMLNLDVVHGRIAFIEILDRPPLR